MLFYRHKLNETKLSRGNIMNEFQGKVAVITGGASGIGRAMAERFAEEGMKIVLADIEATALETTAKEMRADGAEVTAVVCDVSKKEEVERLSQEAVKAYDTVHILCNNAGVSTTGFTWEISLEDWDWVMGVNLWGVVYGTHYFTPIMMKNGDPCHIINTASMAGLTNGLNMTPYYVTKNGVVSMSETMHKELEMIKSEIKISVLCPGWVNTRIHESDRNRPSGQVQVDGSNEAAEQFRDMVAEMLKDGLSPEHVAQMVFDAVVEEQFYILPHAHWNGIIETRMQDILEGRNPTITDTPAN
jgi:NAD(P)-dependent dehydrogenase (short-subunit alcohol dehydrogenase family)